MAEVLTSEQIANIFKEIDADNDGFITRQDLENTNFVISLFETTPNALNVCDLLYRASIAFMTEK